MISKKTFLLSIFILSFILILCGVLIAGWSETWSALLVPTANPPFADLRTVQGSIYSISQGFDPQLINPGDPAKRPMNYPSIWADIAKLLSLDLEQNYLIFVCSYVSLYILVCFANLRQHPSLWILLLIFSGSSLLAIERGNNDLIVFNLLYFSTIAPIIFSAALIIVASILKIYPIFTVGTLYKSKKVLLITTGLLATYILIKLPELQIIRGGTPISASLSYGIPSLQAKFGLTYPAWGVALCMVLFSLISGRIKWIKAHAKSTIYSDRDYKLFLLGASIYLCTFIISSNWDYRLIFLIFCIPYIDKLTGNSLKIILLSSILLASNQMILTHLLGSIVGENLCVLTKCVVFTGLIWILQSNTYFPRNIAPSN